MNCHRASWFRFEARLHPLQEAQHSCLMNDSRQRRCRREGIAEQRSSQGGRGQRPAAQAKAGANNGLPRTNQIDIDLEVFAGHSQTEVVVSFYTIKWGDK